MKKYFNDYLMLGAIAGTIIVLDQWTKWIVRTSLELSETWVPWDWLAPYARIVHWRNTGAAFGLFQSMGGVFTILAIIVTIAIIIYYPQVPRSDWPLRLAMGMQLGGALGNLTDRLFRGYVTDFVSLGNFPVFNVADSSISIGAAILLIGVWISERRMKKLKLAAENSPLDKESTVESGDIQVG